MSFTKTFKECQTALSRTHNGSTFHAVLFTGELSSYTFTAANGTNTFTAANNDFVNGVRVNVSNVGGALPSGLPASTTLFVVNKAGNSFQLSGTKNGAPIDITNDGAGTHTITELAPNASDDLAIWVRHEANYDGAGRVLMNIGEPTEANPSVCPTVSTFFDPVTAISYRYFGVIRDGNATTGNATGILVGTEDYGSTQTITSSGKTIEYTPQLQ
jgi:hypothetical protein